MVNNYALHNIETLRFWCRKVLPLVYDDSLSYYEVLCKVAAKLNEVIENENTQNETITEGATQLSNLANALADEIERAVAKEGDLQSALTALESAAEKITNKTNVVNADSTNNQYPTAKAVYEAMQNMPSGGDNVYIATLTDTYEDVLAQVEAGKAVFFEFKEIGDDNLIYALQAPLVEIQNTSNPPRMGFGGCSAMSGHTKLYYGELNTNGWSTISTIWLTNNDTGTQFSISGRCQIDVAVCGNFTIDNQTIAGWHNIRSEGDGNFDVDGNTLQEVKIYGASMVIANSIDTVGLLSHVGTGYDGSGNSVMWVDLPQKTHIPIAIPEGMDVIYNT